MQFKTEKEMRKYGIAFDPLDPNRLVPLSQLVHSQETAADSVPEERVELGDAHQETSVMSTGSDASFAQNLRWRWKRRHMGRSVHHDGNKGRVHRNSFHRGSLPRDVP